MEKILGSYETLFAVNTLLTEEVADLTEQAALEYLMLHEAAHKHGSTLNGL